MKFICDRNVLSNAVAGVSKAVTQRSSVPVLEGILCKAEGFALTLTGYDLEMGITTTVEANVLEPGETVLPAKLLGDMVRRLSSDEVEITCLDTGVATVKGGITEFDIMTLNPGDFPALPNPGADQTLDIDTADLQEMVETTLYAVSTDDKKPAHTGELFAIEPEKLTVVALDGYRLAIIEKPVKAAKEISIIIPAKTLSEVVKLFGEEDGVVHVAANRRFVVFSNEKYTVISRLIEGEFLDYKRVIPEGFKTRVTVDVRDFVNTIERASLIITERLKNPLRITFDGNITVRCQTTLGKVVDELPAEMEGESVEIGFNNRYLLDALRYSRCDKVVMEISGPLSPVKVTAKDGGDFLFLVLPVRFKNDYRRAGYENKHPYRIYQAGRTVKVCKPVRHRRRGKNSRAGRACKSERRSVHHAGQENIPRGYCAVPGRKP